MIQLAPRHLPLKWCDSTWECGDLGLITHLWWEGGVNICASLRWATATDILVLYGSAHVFTSIFHESFTPAVNFSSHFIKADFPLSRVVFFTLLFIELLERKEEVSYVH